MQFVFGFAPPMIIETALRLGIFGVRMRSIRSNPAPGTGIGEPEAGSPKEFLPASRSANAHCRAVK
jgi:hypothetical protein